MTDEQQPLTARDGVPHPDDTPTDTSEGETPATPAEVDDDDGEADGGGEA